MGVPDGLVQKSLFDTSGFVPRRLCGEWTPELILRHNVSDAFIWLSYIAIPAVLVYLIRRRSDTPLLSRTAERMKAEG